MYAILDIESTGGKFNEEGITEVAIYKFDGHKVVDQFISLINPEQPIQEYVVKLTGISNKMLRNAPKFFEVAKRIIEITEDCTLVAHNASFDYRILRTEFERLGFDFFRNTLCTVELSRQLIPDQKSYSLGKLCRALGIPMSDRHRANGDAIATVELFKLLLDKDTHKNIIQSALKYHDKREQKRRLQNLIDKLPEEMGVFYIHNSEGKIIYIGKGKNIQSEVNRLFIKDSKRALKIKDRAYEVTYENTANELFTRLIYSLEVDSINPKYNFRKTIKKIAQDFAHDNFMIVLPGRIPEENAIILIEKNYVFGYGFTNLSYQENQIKILKTKLTKVSNHMLAKVIVKNFLKKNTKHKVIRF